MTENYLLLFSVIFIPVFTGLISLLLVFSTNGKNTRTVPIFVEIVAVLSTLTVFLLSLFLFLAGEINYSYNWLKNFGVDFSLRGYVFSSFCVVFVSLLGFLTVIYSIKFFAKKNVSGYYGFLLINLGAVNGALLSNNLIVLVSFWGIALLTLYGLLRNPENEHSYNTATKAFFIVGFADFCLLLGTAFLWHLSGTTNISNIHLPVTQPLAVTAFVLMTIGALAKAGSMPFHTWIPDAAKDAAVPVMAYLPGSLDKLLGIYLLARIACDLFVMNAGLGIFLMTIGAFTILAAVFMALIQHDMKRLLSYHAVSQVGYMVLGIGTGTAIGVAGGIFHMLNNAIYKACLFFSSGAVEKQAGHTDLDKLGGLAKVMPVTFIACLIASFSISGIPPFNGFVSKWLIYQGIIQAGLSSQGTFLGYTWWIFLISAMFGSALTLASFMKLIHATFLGQRAGEPAPTPRINVRGKLRGEFIHPSEVHWSMLLPQVVLAGLCVVFGIFAFQVPLKLFILPSLDLSISQSLDLFIGFWQPGLATTLIIAGLIMGCGIYLLGNIKTRESEPFIGGETLPDEVRVTGTDFYQTITELGIFSFIYKKAEDGFFDFYNWGVGIVKITGKILYMWLDKLTYKIVNWIARLTRIVANFTRGLHGGLLSVYLSWSLLGLIILLFILCKW